MEESIDVMLPTNHFEGTFNVSPDAFYWQNMRANNFGALDCKICVNQERFYYVFSSVQRFTQILFLKSIRPIEIMTSLLSTIITFDSIIFVCLMVLFLNEVRKLTTLDAYGD